MASTILSDNGVSSGSAGIKTTADSTGALALQTTTAGGAATTALTISTSQVVTLTNALPVASGGSGVTTSTGTGANVLGTSPTLTTPNIDSAQVATVSGTAPLYMARAWVNFNGTGTVAIRASGNVSSITDNGTGDYTINFTTALPDGNYAPVISSNNTSSNTSVSNNNDYSSVRTTTAYRFAHLEAAALADASVLCVAIFR